MLLCAWSCDVPNTQAHIATAPLVFQSEHRNLFNISIKHYHRAEQPFALIANGQKVMVTCPPNVKPGQKIRFQLPIQLSQQQLETFKVSYDKDGWMRCLGTDLKFHWVYNQADSAENSTVANPNAKVQYDEYRRAFVRQFVDDPVKPTLSYINATDYAIETSVKGLAINYTELNMVASQPFQEKCEWLKTQFANLRVPWYAYVFQIFLCCAFGNSTVFGPGLSVVQIARSRDFVAGSICSLIVCFYSTLSCCHDILLYACSQSHTHMHSHTHTYREEGHIKLKVRRQSVLQDSMDAIESIEPADMRKIFRYTLAFDVRALPYMQYHCA